MNEERKENDYKKRLGPFNQFLEENEDKRYIVLEGGAGSGKSVSIAQRLAKKYLQEKRIGILITRKTLPSLKRTCWKLMRNILDGWGVKHFVDENKTEGLMQYNGNEILFCSIDNEAKIKSFEANYIWMEEATEFEYADFLQLDLRLRQSTVYKNHLYLSYNPIDINNWAVREFVTKTNPKAAVMHSTHEDNPLLDKDSREQILDLINKDENFYRIYCLGLPGVIEGKIYTHHKIVKKEQWPDAVSHRKPDYYGLDIGYNHPMVLMAVWYEDGALFWHEVFHARFQTIPDLIKFMDETNVDRTTPIACPPESPSTIEDLTRAGYNAVKANNAVADGIGYVKSCKLTISEESVNTIKEMDNYKYKEMPMLGPDGKKMFYNEPVKIFDDGPDAGRYGSFTFRTIVNTQAQSLDTPCYGSPDIPMYRKDSFPF